MSSNSLHPTHPTWSRRLLINWGELWIVGSCLFQMKMILLVNHTEFQSKLVHRCLEPHPRISIFNLTSNINFILFVYQWEKQRLDELHVCSCLKLVAKCLHRPHCEIALHSQWILIDGICYWTNKVREMRVFERSWNNSVLNERSMITGAQLKASWIVTDVSSWETERACGSFCLVCGCWTGA